jgi:hypothetical protein
MLDFSQIVAQEKPEKPVRVFDIDTARNEISKYNDEFVMVESRAIELEVNDDDGAKLATEMLGQVVTFRKNLELKRKEIIKNPDEFVRAVNAIVKPVRERIDAIVKLIKEDKLGPYQYRKELKRREDERKAREAAAAQQAAIDAEAKKMGVETVQLPEMVIPQKKAPVRTESGTTTTIMVKKFRVIDLDQVPRDFLLLNEQKVRAAMSAGVNVAGIEYYEEPQVRVRTH